MFALGVEFLMRRAVMTRWDNRESAEWPPHPDRVFMALVAAFGENGEHEMEQKALEWLESQGAPALRASVDASERTLFTSFVPVNDAAEPIAKKKALAPMGSLPIGRNRQPRSFPTVVPACETFHLVWPKAELPANVEPALDRLCRNVTYLGHSSSPVRVWIDRGAIEPTLVPTEGRAKHQLRAFGPGRLEDLRERHKHELRPQPALWVGYAEPPKEVPEPEHPSPFDPGLIVLRQVDGRKFSLESAGMIADALRDTLMSRQGVNPPEWLTGHAADSSQSRADRPAMLPLGFVDREHSDGHLLGVALALPRLFDPEHAAHLIDLLAKHGEPDDVAAEGVGFVKLRLTGGEMLLELDERPASKRAYTLQIEPWTKPSAEWRTVTPVLLPRFPRRGLKAETIIAEACVEAGYPEPAEVSVSFAPFLVGVPHARSFVVKPQPGRPPRQRMHASIRFPHAIRGPVLVGAGRYRGYGFCRPHDE